MQQVLHGESTIESFRRKNMRYPYNYDDDMLLDITSFIAQEIYVLAVRQQFPLEFDLIRQLGKNIKEKLNFIKENYNESSAYETISEMLINNIVMDEDNGLLLEKIEHYLDNLYTVHEEEDGLINHINDLKKDASTCLKELFEIYSNFESNFIHHYPPYVLLLDNNYLHSLAYFCSKEYLPKKENTTEGRITSITHAPFELRRRYENSKYRTKDIQNEIEVPTSTLKRSTKKININEFEGDERLLEAFYTLNFLTDQDTVSITHELRVSIDTSTPLDDLTVDKILAMVRYNLSRVQLKNKDAKYLLAENMYDLKKAMNIPDIKIDDQLLNIKRLYTPQVNGLKNDYSAKDYLCGLVILYRNFFDDEYSNTSISNLCSDLSDELMGYKISNLGFSDTTIQKGYNNVKRLFDNQIKLLKDDSISLRF
ncbi:hypothetical protein AB6F65_18735 [Providencia hangzhouensis]|uniref:hypothetical protein n=1 Tax=Providencia hangzhouensis TaxID=3031799 RepID=UPI0034DD3272